MIFSSQVFLCQFLPIFLLLYYLSPRSLKSYTIAFGSYVFYGWWRPDFVGLMLFSTVLDYTCGARIHAAQAKGKTGKPFLLLSVIANLALLGYFKYANFGIETANALLGSWGMESVSWTKVVLPVGISFYTFQTMSYTIDVYRKTSPPVKNFRDHMCYVSLFPQLVAGPIVRYNTVADQLWGRTHSFEKFYRGVLAFQIGFCKKLLIADNLAPVADQAFAGQALSAEDAWIGIVAYAFQIYFDFSAYSDMAIGLGLMLGFQFPINFNSPYRSISITDFWRRWHISLSRFLRDYLYIPLGGNKRGPIRTYVNLSLTMLLGGLWHGANWTFIAWGAYQGLWLVLERRFGRKAFYSFLPKPGQIAATFIIALGGWVFFRAATIGDAGQYFASMIGATGQTEPLLQVRFLHVVAFTIGALIVWFAPTSQRLIKAANPVFALLLQPLFLVALVHLNYLDHVPFLYYQF